MNRNKFTPIAGVNIIDEDLKPGRLQKAGCV
jgi:hypothetical protein